MQNSALELCKSKPAKEEEGSGGGSKCEQTSNFILNTVCSEHCKRAVACHKQHPELYPDSEVNKPKAAEQASAEDS